MTVKVRGGERHSARTGGACTKSESSPFATNIELFRSVQEEVSLGAIRETRRNLPNAGLQDLRVEHGAISPGEISLVWRSVERASAVLTGVASALDRLITTMGVISSVFRHRTGLGGGEKRKGAQFQTESLLNGAVSAPRSSLTGVFISLVRRSAGWCPMPLPDWSNVHNLGLGDRDFPAGHRLEHNWLSPTSHSCTLNPSSDTVLVRQ